MALQVSDQDHRYCTQEWTCSRYGLRYGLYVLLDLGMDLAMMDFRLYRLLDLDLGLGTNGGQVVWILIDDR